MSSSSSTESPTTPTLEHDITHTKVSLAHGDSPGDDDYGRSDPELSEINSYPPMSSQEAETRRVEETLRQWEIAEKQRRRAARESSSSIASAGSSSLLGDVTRRASLLWKGGSRTRNPPTGAKHMALGSTDNLDTVPLEGIPASPTPSPSILSSSQQQTPDIDASVVTKKQVDSTSSDHEDVTGNPFDTPETSFALDAVSPFSDVHQVNQPITIESSTEDNYRSRLQPSFDQPEHGTSPPVSVTSPPQPINSPNVSRRKGKGKEKDSEDDEEPVRWWHEWLCGCGEGSDRGGDNQAGRTNPLE